MLFKSIFAIGASVFTGIVAAEDAAYACKHHELLSLEVTNEAPALAARGPMNWLLARVKREVKTDSATPTTATATVTMTFTLVEASDGAVNTVPCTTVTVTPGQPIPVPVATPSSTSIPPAIPPVAPSSSSESPVQSTTCSSEHPPTNPSASPATNPGAPVPPLPSSATPATPATPVTGTVTSGTAIVPPAPSTTLVTASLSTSPPGYGNPGTDTPTVPSIATTVPVTQTHTTVHPSTVNGAGSFQFGSAAVLGGVAAFMFAVV